MNKLLSLFFNESLRRWHFEYLVNESGLSRERVNHYIKELIIENLINKIKEKGKMPYYISNRVNPRFRLEKKQFGIGLIIKSGLFDHISSIKEIRSAFLFGSFSRGDWNKSSDVDLFIYGDSSIFDKAKFERILGRNIQLFSFDKKKKIKDELDKKLIPNIINGFNIKENIEPFEVSI